MKLIIAIVKPSKVQDIRTALVDIGVEGMTTSEVSGFGRQKGHTEIYRGAEYEISFVPKVKIEVATTNEQASAVIEAITSSAETGNIGDGKIFVLDLGETVRIRTGETGDEAL
ncbi:MAG: transcriptional regulator [Planctomycetaceae bacterium]|nr:transcriptional regulator [Planctomycetaceae bacterium]